MKDNLEQLKNNLIVSCQALPVRDVSVHSLSASSLQGCRSQRAQHRGNTERCLLPDNIFRLQNRRRGRGRSLSARGFCISCSNSFLKS